MFHDKPLFETKLFHSKFTQDGLLVPQETLDEEVKVSDDVIADAPGSPWIDILIYEEQQVSKRLKKQQSLKD